MYDITELNSRITPSDQPCEWFVLDRYTKIELLEFYNVHQDHFDTEDMQILADLFNGVTGSIYWEDCAECGERLCIANPHSWDSLQGSICSKQSNYLEECCISSLSSEEF